MIIEIIPCLSDNYSYLIHEKETKYADETPIINVIVKTEKSITNELFIYSKRNVFFNKIR